MVLVRESPLSYHYGGKEMYKSLVEVISLGRFTRSSIVPVSPGLRVDID